MPFFGFLNPPQLVGVLGFSFCFDYDKKKTKAETAPPNPVKAEAAAGSRFDGI